MATENELRFGVRQEGILYSTRALAAKIDQAIGSLLAGFVLVLIAFPQKAVPGAVEGQVLFNLALWDGIMAAIPGLIAALCYGRYSINRAKYEATRAAIEEKRARARAAPDPEPPPLASAAPAPAE